MQCTQRAKWWERATGRKKKIFFNNRTNAPTISTEKEMGDGLEREIE